VTDAAASVTHPDACIHGAGDAALHAGARGRAHPESGTGVAGSGPTWQPYASPKWGALEIGDAGGGIGPGSAAARDPEVPRGRARVVAVGGFTGMDVVANDQFA
jgi:hypothetical protein